MEALVGDALSRLLACGEALSPLAGGGEALKQQATQFDLKTQQRSGMVFQQPDVCLIGEICGTYTARRGTSSASVHQVYKQQLLT